MYAINWIIVLSYSILHKICRIWSFWLSFFMCAFLLPSHLYTYTKVLVTGLYFTWVFSLRVTFKFCPILERHMALLFNCCYSLMIREWSDKWNIWLPYKLCIVIDYCSQLLMISPLWPDTALRYCTQQSIHNNNNTIME